MQEALKEAPDRTGIELDNQRTGRGVRDFDVSTTVPAQLRPRGSSGVAIGAVHR